MNKLLMIGLLMAVAVASTSEFQSADGTFVPEDTAVTPKEELTQTHFFSNIKRHVKRHVQRAKKHAKHHAKKVERAVKRHVQKAKKHAKHHAKKVERAVKHHAQKMKKLAKKVARAAKRHNAKKAEKRNQKMEQVAKRHAKKAKAKVASVKSLVKKLVRRHVKKQLKKHIRKYHSERSVKRNRFTRIVGPTRHLRGNSRFENSSDRRVDDVDDTTSPWACSLYNSPWFACVPRKGDTTNLHRYRTKNPYGRRTWECSVDMSMWYPCKARSRDVIVRAGDKYFAHYPSRTKMGKATEQWLKRRNLMKHKRLYFRPKIPSFHVPKGPKTKIRFPRVRRL